MAIAFFYGSIAAIWIVLFICAVKRPLTFKHILIAITAIGYSLLYETSLGEYARLYYYITPESSLFYIILSAVLIYPMIDVIYAMFLPEKASAAVMYTAAWIVFMLAFELASLYTKTVVLTGWRVLPWSVITYIVTFAWINLLFRYLKKRGL
ncbi:MAG: hypothetical protein APF77_00330 [Clostridia bacterium BRH_c25]|nr:MAG: hypothetical protein APF77_00330 [Clostridia bacterium BRH_c25]